MQVEVKERNEHKSYLKFTTYFLEYCSLVLSTKNVCSLVVFTNPICNFVYIDWQALLSLAEEISKSPIPQGSRKINGKYIQSHLVLRLQGMTTLCFVKIANLMIIR